LQLLYYIASQEIHRFQLGPGRTTQVHLCTTYKNKVVEDKYIHAYRFAVSTGVRPGELIVLRCGDIVNDVAEIKGSINVLSEKTKGKNNNAVQPFVLQDVAKNAVALQLQLLKDAGVTILPSTPLFQIDRERTFYTAWLRYCRANDIPQISLYELRHSFVSAAKYMPAGLVKPLVGHSQAMDTFGTYGHEILGDDKLIAKNLNRIFKKIIKWAKSDRTFDRTFDLKIEISNVI